MDSKETLDTVALLQEQIKTLHELIKAKDELIQVLRHNQYSPNPISPLAPYNPFMPIGVNPMIVTCQHEYPSMWGGTMPPGCTKCGQQFQNYPTFTGATSVLKAI